MKVVILQNDPGYMKYLIEPVKKYFHCFQSVAGSGKAMGDVFLIRSNSKPLDLYRLGNIVEMNKQEDREKAYDKVKMKEIIKKALNKKFIIEEGKGFGDIWVVKKQHHQQGNGIWFVTNSKEMEVIKKKYKQISVERFIPFSEEYRLLVFYDKVILIEKYLDEPSKAVGSLVRGGMQGYRYKFVKEIRFGEYRSIADRLRKAFNLQFFTIDIGRYKGKSKVIEVNSTLPMPLFSEQDKKIIGKIFADGVSKAVRRYASHLS